MILKLKIDLTDRNFNCATREVSVDLGINVSKDAVALAYTGAAALLTSNAIESMLDELAKKGEKA